MQKVNYSSDFLEIVKDLSSINESIIFDKEQDKVFVRRMNDTKTTAYILEVDVDNFNFDGDVLCIYRYNEFYRYFKFFSNPEIFKDDRLLILSQDNAQIHYPLYEKEACLPEGPKSFNFPTSVISLTLTKDNIEKFIKVSSLNNAKKAQVFGNEKNMTVKLFNSNYEVSYDQKFEVNSLNNFIGEYDFTYFLEFFTKIPVRNYKMEFSDNGYLKLNLIDDSMKLTIFTSSVKK
jgi:hypothetical protein